MSPRGDRDVLGKIERLVRLALNDAAAVEEQRTAALSVVRMIQKYKIQLTLPDERPPPRREPPPPAPTAARTSATSRPDRPRRVYVDFSDTDVGADFFNQARQSAAEILEEIRRQSAEAEEIRRQSAEAAEREETRRRAEEAKREFVRESERGSPGTLRGDWGSAAMDIFCFGCKRRIPAGEPVFFRIPHCEGHWWCQDHDAKPPSPP